jgi:predicted esterase
VPDAPIADWCAPGFEPLPGGACFAASQGSVQPLIVYLHGRYAREVTSDEKDRQRRLAVRANSRGFAVIAFRGRLGGCAAPELADWFCWPTSERAPEDAASSVQRWAQSLAIARQRVGSRGRFLLGFSNGGYFAGLLVARGLLEFDAVVVAHGGPIEPVRALKGKPPLLLLSADDDVAQTDMIRFDGLLAREQWAHDAYARAGGHGLTDEDIDAALTFFVRAKERLPLNPPLPLHRAVLHFHDAATTSRSAEPPAGTAQEIESSDASVTRSGDDSGVNESGSAL